MTPVRKIGKSREDFGASDERNFAGFGKLEGLGTPSFIGTFARAYRGNGKPFPTLPKATDMTTHDPTRQTQGDDELTLASASPGRAHLQMPIDNRLRNARKLFPSIRCLPVDASSF